LEVRVDTYHDYLRTYSSELGARIVEMYPPLQGPKDPIAPTLKTLLRRPLPAQAMTITGASKYLQTEDTVRLVGECGTGKALMSIGIAHAHANGKPYFRIAFDMSLRSSVGSFVSPIARPEVSWNDSAKIRPSGRNAG
jgi:hypothetical protein